STGGGAVGECELHDGANRAARPRTHHIVQWNLVDEFGVVTSVARLGRAFSGMAAAGLSHEHFVSAFCIFLDRDPDSDQAITSEIAGCRSAVGLGAEVLARRISYEEPRLRTSPSEVDDGQESAGSAFLSY